MNNNNYYNKPVFPGPALYSGDMPTPNQEMAPNYTGSPMLPLEQSYIENILRLNRGKKVRVHQTFPDSVEWRDLEFNGIIEQSGRDHILLSDPSTGKWHLLLMIYVDYISLDEKINYSPDFSLNNN